MYIIIIKKKKIAMILFMNKRRIVVYSGSTLKVLLHEDVQVFIMIVYSFLFKGWLKNSWQ